MSVVIIFCFAVVWTGVVWAAAMLQLRLAPDEGVRSRFWLTHLAAAVLPLAALFAAPLLPPLQPGLADTAHMLRLPALQLALPAGETQPATGADWPAGLAPDLPVVLVFVWLGGVLALVSRLVAGRIVLARIVRRACPVLISRSGLPVLVTDERITPFAVSWRLLSGAGPAIVLPAALIEALGEAGVEPVIEHEAAHIRRGDPLTADLLALVSALVWFSPFVMKMVARWRLSAELACDEAALSGAGLSGEGRTARRHYAQILLSAYRITAGLDGTATPSGRKFATGRALPCPPAAFSTSQLKDEKMRIKAIMRGLSVGGKGRGAAIVSGLVAAMLMTTGAGAAVLAASPAGSVEAVPMSEGVLTAYFGMQKNPKDRTQDRMHVGVDYAAPYGTPIVAPADGVIVEAGEGFRGMKAYGYAVAIQTGNVVTLFAHLDSYQVSTGERVVAGQQLGKLGNSGRSTGAHVHIETYVDGELTDPMEVWDWLAAARDKKDKKKH